MNGVFEIHGGRKISGEITVQGAKNSALPILAATVLTDGVSVIKNCPKLSDVDATVNILRHLGCDVKHSDNTCTVDSRNVENSAIPENLMHEMRSSIIFLGAIIGRFGKAEMFAPGGCEIGLRPIDLHLDAIRSFGVNVKEEHGKIVCECSDGLRATDITLSFPSVGATENIMLTACFANGTTTLFNAAREPEISDLADFLNACGAKIHGAGSGEIIIEGVKKLGGCRHSVIPDRIVASTYLTAAAMTGGNIRLKNIIPAHIGPVLPIFRESGCEVEVKGRDVSLKAPRRLKTVKNIRTMPYPGFPTDMQALIMAMMSIADGTCVIVETIFESRYKHVGELNRLGANIRVEGRAAVVEGVDLLTGASVLSPDLRGGCALVLAGLAASGTTTVSDIRHIDRGYEDICKVLSSLGADIKRIDESEQKT